MQKQLFGSSVPEEAVLWMCCGFPGAYLCVGGCDFNEVAKRLLLRLRFCIDVFLWVCFMFVEHLSWRAPLEDCFWMKIVLYTLLNLFLLIKYAFENFKVSVPLQFWLVCINPCVDFYLMFVRFLLYWWSFCKESEIITQ